MEPSNENLRFYVFVETKRGVSATDILEQLISVFSDRAPSRAFVFKWWKAYSEGTSTSVKTMPPPGRPVSVTTPANISRVFDFVQANPKSSLSLISDSLSLSKETVRLILVEELREMFAYDIK